MRPPKDARESLRHGEPRGIPGECVSHDAPLALVDEQGRILARSRSWQHEFRAPDAGERPAGIEAFFDDASSAALLRVLRAPQPAGEIDVRTRSGRAGRAAVRVCSTRQGLRIGVVTLGDSEPRRDPEAADHSASPVGELRHKLSGPVTAALGAAELLLGREDVELADETRHGLDQIVANCARMMEMIAASRADDLEAHRERDGEPWES